ncbi:hypothetical protein SK128_000641, partial [Halocaridina rubra]
MTDQCIHLQNEANLDNDFIREYFKSQQALYRQQIEARRQYRETAVGEAFTSSSSAGNETPTQAPEARSSATTFSSSSSSSSSHQDHVSTGKESHHRGADQTDPTSRNASRTSASNAAAAKSFAGQSAKTGHQRAVTDPTKKPTSPLTGDTVKDSPISHSETCTPLVLVKSPSKSVNQSSSFAVKSSNTDSIAPVSPKERSVTPLTLKVKKSAYQVSPTVTSVPEFSSPSSSPSSSFPSGRPSRSSARASRALSRFSLEDSEDEDSEGHREVVPTPQRRSRKRSGRSSHAQDDPDYHASSIVVNTIGSASVAPSPSSPTPTASSQPTSTASHTHSSDLKDRVPSLKIKLPESVPNTSVSSSINHSEKPKRTVSVSNVKVSSSSIVKLMDVNAPKLSDENRTEILHGDRAPEKSERLKVVSKQSTRTVSAGAKHKKSKNASKPSLVKTKNRGDSERDTENYIPAVLPYSANPPTRTAKESNERIYSSDNLKSRGPDCANLQPTVSLRRLGPVASSDKTASKDEALTQKDGEKESVCVTTDMDNPSVRSAESLDIDEGESQDLLVLDTSSRLVCDSTDLPTTKHENLIAKSLRNVDDLSGERKDSETASQSVLPPESHIENKSESSLKCTQTKSVDPSSWDNILQESIPSSTEDPLSCVSYSLPGVTVSRVKMQSTLTSSETQKRSTLNNPVSDESTLNAKPGERASRREVEIRKRMSIDGVSDVEGRRHFLDSVEYQNVEKASKVEEGEAKNISEIKDVLRDPLRVAEGLESITQSSSQAKHISSSHMPVKTRLWEKLLDTAKRKVCPSETLKDEYDIDSSTGIEKSDSFKDIQNSNCDEGGHPMCKTQNSKARSLDLESTKQPSLSVEEDSNEHSNIVSKLIMALEDQDTEGARRAQDTDSDPLGLPGDPIMDETNIPSTFSTERSLESRPVISTSSLDAKASALLFEFIDIHSDIGPKVTEGSDLIMGSSQEKHLVSFEQPFVDPPDSQLGSESNHPLQESDLPPLLEKLDGKFVENMEKPKEVRLQIEKGNEDLHRISTVETSAMSVNASEDIKSPESKKAEHKDSADKITDITNPEPLAAAAAVRDASADDFEVEPKSEKQVIPSVTCASDFPSKEALTSKTSILEKETVTLPMQISEECSVVMKKTQDGKVTEVETSKQAKQEPALKARGGATKKEVLKGNDKALVQEACQIAEVRAHNTTLKSLAKDEARCSEPLTNEEEKVQSKKSEENEVPISSSDIKLTEPSTITKESTKIVISKEVKDVLELQENIQETEEPPKHGVGEAKKQICEVGNEAKVEEVPGQGEDKEVHSSDRKVEEEEPPTPDLSSYNSASTVGSLAETSLVTSFEVEKKISSDDHSDETISNTSRRTVLSSGVKAKGTMEEDAVNQDMKINEIPRSSISREEVSNKAKVITDDVAASQKEKGDLSTKDHTVVKASPMLGKKPHLSRAKIFLKTSESGTFKGSNEIKHLIPIRKLEIQSDIYKPSAMAHKEDNIVISKGKADSIIAEDPVLIAREKSEISLSQESAKLIDDTPPKKLFSPISAPHHIEPAKSHIHEDLKGTKKKAMTPVCKSSLGGEIKKEGLAASSICGKESKTKTPTDLKIPVSSSAAEKVSFPSKDSPKDVAGLFRSEEKSLSVCVEGDSDVNATPLEETSGRFGISEALKAPLSLFVQSEKFDPSVLESNEHKDLALEYARKTEENSELSPSKSGSVSDLNPSISTSEKVPPKLETAKTKNSEVEDKMLRSECPAPPVSNLYGKATDSKVQSKESELGKKHKNPGTILPVILDKDGELPSKISEKVEPDVHKNITNEGTSSLINKDLPESSSTDDCEQESLEFKESGETGHMVKSGLSEVVSSISKYTLKGSAIVENRPSEKLVSSLEVETTISAKSDASLTPIKSSAKSELKFITEITSTNASSSIKTELPSTKSDLGFTTCLSPTKYDLTPINDTSSSKCDSEVNRELSSLKSDLGCTSDLSPKNSDLTPIESTSSRASVLGIKTESATKSDLGLTASLSFGKSESSLQAVGSSITDSTLTDEVSPLKSEKSSIELSSKKSDETTTPSKNSDLGVTADKSLGKSELGLETRTVSVKSDVGLRVEMSSKSDVSLTEGSNSGKLDEMFRKMPAKGEASLTPEAFSGKANSSLQAETSDKSDSVAIIEMASTKCKLSFTTKTSSEISDPNLNEEISSTKSDFSLPTKILSAKSEIIATEETAIDENKTSINSDTSPEADVKKSHVSFSSNIASGKSLASFSSATASSKSDLKVVSATAISSKSDSVVIAKLTSRKSESGLEPVTSKSDVSLNSEIASKESEPSSNLGTDLRKAGLSSSPRIASSNLEFSLCSESPLRKSESSQSLETASRKVESISSSETDLRKSDSDSETALRQSHSSFKSDTQEELIEADELGKLDSNATENQTLNKIAAVSKFDSECISNSAVFESSGNKNHKSKEKVETCREEINENISELCRDRTLKCVAEKGPLASGRSKRPDIEDLNVHTDSSCEVVHSLVERNISEGERKCKKTEEISKDTDNFPEKDIDLNIIGESNCEASMPREKNISKPVHQTLEKSSPLNLNIEESKVDLPISAVAKSEFKPLGHVKDSSGSDVLLDSKCKPSPSDISSEINVTPVSQFKSFKERIGEDKSEKVDLKSTFLHEENAEAISEAHIDQESKSLGSLACIDQDAKKEIKSLGLHSKNVKVIAAEMQKVPDHTEIKREISAFSKGRSLTGTIEYVSDRKHMTDNLHACEVETEGAISSVTTKKATALCREPFPDPNITSKQKESTNKSFESYNERPSSSSMKSQVHEKDGLHEASKSPIKTTPEFTRLESSVYSCDIKSKLGSSEPSKTDALLSRCEQKSNISKTATDPSDNTNVERNTRSQSIEIDTISDTASVTVKSITSNAKVVGTAGEELSGSVAKDIGSISVKTTDTKDENSNRLDRRVSTGGHSDSSTEVVPCSVTDTNVAMPECCKLGGDSVRVEKKESHGNSEQNQHCSLQYSAVLSCKTPDSLELREVGTSKEVTSATIKGLSKTKSCKGLNKSASNEGIGEETVRKVDLTLFGTVAKEELNSSSNSRKNEESSRLQMPGESFDEQASGATKNSASVSECIPSTSVASSEYCEYSKSAISVPSNLTSCTEESPYPPLPLSSPQNISSFVTSKNIIEKSASGLSHTDTQKAEDKRVPIPDFSFSRELSSSASKTESSSTYIKTTSSTVAGTDREIHSTNVNMNTLRHMGNSSAMREKSLYTFHSSSIPGHSAKPDISIKERITPSKAKAKVNFNSIADIVGLNTKEDSSENTSEGLALVRDLGHEGKTALVKDLGHEGKTKSNQSISGPVIATSFVDVPSYCISPLTPLSQIQLPSEKEKLLPPIQKDSCNKDKSGPICCENRSLESSIIQSAKGRSFPVQEENKEASISSIISTKELSMRHGMEALCPTKSTVNEPYKKTEVRKEIHTPPSKSETCPYSSGILSKMDLLQIPLPPPKPNPQCNTLVRSPISSQSKTTSTILSSNVPSSSITKDRALSLAIESPASIPIPPERKSQHSDFIGKKSFSPVIKFGNLSAFKEKTDSGHHASEKKSIGQYPLEKIDSECRSSAEMKGLKPLSPEKKHIKLPPTGKKESGFSSVEKQNIRGLPVEKKESEVHSEKRRDLLCLTTKAKDLSVYVGKNEPVEASTEENPVFSTPRIKHEKEVEVKTDASSAKSSCRSAYDSDDKMLSKGRTSGTMPFVSFKSKKFHMKTDLPVNISNTSECRDTSETDSLSTVENRYGKHPSQESSYPQKAGFIFRGPLFGPKDNVMSVTGESGMDVIRKSSDTKSSKATESGMDVIRKFPDTKSSKVTEHRDLHVVNVGEGKIASKCETPGGGASDSLSRVYNKDFSHSTAE